MYRFREEFGDIELRQAATSIAESVASGLNVEIEAIHVGVTRNFTRYSSQELSAAVPTWTVPYPRPVLLNHSRYSGEPIGRVMSAAFGASAYPGVAECITLGVYMICDDSIEKIKDKRYMTVSVGGTAESVICSICNANRAKEYCDHEPGSEYDGKLCVFDMHGITFDEISFVNVPADKHAGVVAVADDSPELVKDADTPAEAAAPEESVSASAVVCEQLGEAKAKDNPGGPKGKDGKPIGKMKTGNRKQAHYGHNLLHAYWRKGDTNWKKDQIIKEHKRVVRIIISKGWAHTMLDSLDNTLPDDLKSKSRKK